MSPVGDDVAALRAAVVLRPSAWDYRNPAGEADPGLRTAQTTIKAVAGIGVWTRPIATYQMSEIIL
jgi:hypothetical protein